MRLGKTFGALAAILGTLVAAMTYQRAGGNVSRDFLYWETLIAAVAIAVVVYPVGRKYFTIRELGWGTIYLMGFGAVLNILIPVHDLTYELVFAYRLWWFGLLAVVLLTEALGAWVENARLYEVEEGSPIRNPWWWQTPLFWKPTYTWVSVPVLFVVAIEAILKWTDIARPWMVKLAEKPVPPTVGQPLLWVAKVLIVWGQHGEGVAAALGVLAPAVLIACGSAIVAVLPGLVGGGAYQWKIAEVEEAGNPPVAEAV